MAEPMNAKKIFGQKSSNAFKKNLWWRGVHSAARRGLTHLPNTTMKVCSASHLKAEFKSAWILEVTSSEFGQKQLKTHPWMQVPVLVGKQS
jgi:hypothetical protein